MRHSISSGVLALGALLAVPAAAQDDAIVVESPLMHPAAGLMNDHMHEGGELMLGLRFERMHFGGTNRSGSDAISDADMVSGMRALGSREGISAAPEGGAALHAVKVLMKDGRIKPTESVVVFNTGGALKYLDVL